MFTYDQIRCYIHNLLSHISITGEIVHPCCLEHRVGQKMNQSVSRVCQNDIVVNQASNGFAIKDKSCLLTLQERVTQKNTFQAYSTYPMKCSLSAVSGYDCLHSQQNTMTIHYSFPILTWVRPSPCFILTYWVCLDILVSRYHLQCSES